LYNKIVSKIVVISMAIKMNPDTYDKASEILSSTENKINKVISEINFVKNNLDSKISVYVNNDLTNIANNIDDINYVTHIISENITTKAEEFRNLEHKTSKTIKTIGTLGGAAIGSSGGLIGATAGASIGYEASKVILENTDLAHATASVVTEAVSLIGDLYTSVKEKIGNVVNDIEEAVNNAAAKVVTKAETAYDWIVNKAKEVGDFTWHAITHPGETLARTGASLANTAVGLVQGLAEFGEALLDTATILGTAFSTPFYALADGIQWIGGKITGNEDWHSFTKAAWSDTMDFVSTKYVTNAFDSFHQNNVIGKWLDEYSYSPFKSTGAVYKVADGVGYIGGVLLLTLATMGIGGAAAGAGAAGTGAATGSGAGVLATINVGNVATINITQQAVTAGTIAATSGFGKNTQNAWADGASLGEGLAYGTAMGLWEGLEMFVGAEINTLKFPGLTGVKGQLITTGSHVTLDTIDGASAAFISPAMQMIYNPNEKNMQEIMYLVNYDENGIQIDNKTWEDLTITEKYQAMFKYNGGWGAVGTQAITAGTMSFITEIPDIKKAITASKIASQAAGTAPVALMADEATSGIKTLEDGQVPKQPLEATQPLPVINEQTLAEETANSVKVIESGYLTEKEALSKLLEMEKKYNINLYDFDKMLDIADGKIKYTIEDIDKLVQDQLSTIKVVNEASDYLKTLISTDNPNAVLDGALAYKTLKKLQNKYQVELFDITSYEDFFTGKITYTYSDIEALLQSKLLPSVAPDPIKEIQKVSLTQKIIDSDMALNTKQDFTEINKIIANSNNSSQPINKVVNANGNTYTVYSNYGEYLKTQEANIQSVIDSLTPQEREVIQYYISEGDYRSYKSMNGFARNSLFEYTEINGQKVIDRVKLYGIYGTGDYSVEDFISKLKNNNMTLSDYVKQASEDFEVLKSAIEKSPLPENMVLFRGVGENFLKIFDENINSSTNFSYIEKAIMAKGIFSDDAFLSVSATPTSGPFGKNIQLVLNCEKGTPALDFSKLGGIPSEQELLLGPGQAFKITGVEQVGMGGTIRIYADTINKSTITDTLSATIDNNNIAKSITNQLGTIDKPTNTTISQPSLKPFGVDDKTPIKQVLENGSTNEYLTGEEALKRLQEMEQKHNISLYDMDDTFDICDGKIKYTLEDIDKLVEDQLEAKKIVPSTDEVFSKTMESDGKTPIQKVDKFSTFIDRAPTYNNLEDLTDYITKRVSQASSGIQPSTEAISQ